MPPGIYASVQVYSHHANPRTIHGKIDVQELMNQKQSLESGTLYSPPESELEHQLVQVWSELFQTESVGIDDDFFQLGGHSLLVIRMEIELERVGHHVMTYHDIRSSYHPRACSSTGKREE